MTHPHCRYSGLAGLLLCPAALLSQTLVLNPDRTAWEYPVRPGLNFAQLAQYGPGQIEKNLLYTDNPAMEGWIESQVIHLAGGPVTGDNAFDQVPANFWAGGRFHVLVAASPGAKGCQGNIVSNLGGNSFANQVSATYDNLTGVASFVSNSNPVDWQTGQTVSVYMSQVDGYNNTQTVTVIDPTHFTIQLVPGLNLGPDTGYVGRNVSYYLDASCAAALQAGDEIGVTTSGIEGPVTESACGALAYNCVTLAGGATAEFAAGDVPAGNGTHALQIDATASAGASATMAYSADAAVQGELESVLLNGGRWQAGVDAKVTSCASVCTFTLGVSRGNFQADSGAFLPSVEAAAGGGWSHFSFTTEPDEMPSATSQNSVQYEIATSGQGVFLFKNVSLRQDSGLDPTNTGTYRDAVVAAVREYRPGTLRYWDNQSGETLDNWITPLDGAQRASYSQERSGIYFGQSTTQRVFDFLELCALVGADPWIVLPTWWRPSEAGDFIDFLAGDGSTVYGSKRIALGRGAPYTLIFGKIHLELGNEPWNGGFSGENMPNPANYGNWSALVFGAMKERPSFAPRRFDLVMGCQEVNSYACIMAHEQDPSGHDSIAIAGYNPASGGPLAVTGSQMWQALFGEAYGFSNDPVNGAGASYRDAIAASTRNVPVEVYEYAASDSSVNTASASLSDLASEVSGLGGALSEAIGDLEFLREFNQARQKWNLAQFEDQAYDQNGNAIGSIPLWGVALDFGGDTGRLRPSFHAHQMINNAVMGRMVEVNWAGNPAYASPEVNGHPSIQNVPVLFGYEFAEGAERSLVLINSDARNAYTITWGGIPPRGTGVETLLTSEKLSDNNESAHTVAPRTNEVEFSSTYTIPAASLVTLRWSASDSNTSGRRRTQ